MNQSLQELLFEKRTLTEELIEARGELPVELEEKIDSLEIATAEKVDRTISVLHSLADATERLAKEKAKFDAAIKVAKRASDRINLRIKYLMEQADEDKLDGIKYAFKTAKTPARVVIDNDEAVPMEYKSTKTLVSVDKNKVKDVLKSGQSVPGCKLETGIRVKEVIK